jgi:hypothetical protein
MKGIRWEPAVYLYGLNSVVALAVAFGLPLTSTQTAAVAVIATAVLGGISAALTRPVEVSAITAALATALTAAGAFGLHLSADRIGTLVTVVNLAIALLVRQNVTPAATVARAKAAAAHPAVTGSPAV